MLSRTGLERYNADMARIATEREKQAKDAALQVWCILQKWPKGSGGAHAQRKNDAHILLLKVLPRILEAIAKQSLACKSLLVVRQGEVNPL